MRQELLEILEAVREEEREILEEGAGTVSYTHLEKMRIVSVAPLFAEAMTRIFTNGSISKLFD